MTDKAETELKACPNPWFGEVEKINADLREIELMLSDECRAGKPYKTELERAKRATKASASLLDESATTLSRPTPTRLAGECKRLFCLLDDIDTQDDICKSNDAAFRKNVRRIQRKRFDGGITTDGYTLDLNALSQPAPSGDVVGYRWRSLFDDDGPHNTSDWVFSAKPVGATMKPKEGFRIECQPLFTQPPTDKANELLREIRDAANAGVEFGTEQGASHWRIALESIAANIDQHLQESGQ